MLYKFKSKATGDVIMLQPHGERVLGIIGKHHADAPSIQGILLPEQMPAALAALQAAIAQEEAVRQDAVALAQAEHQPAPRFESIALRQRALPFMDMIRACMAADEAMTWGV